MLQNKVHAEHPMPASAAAPRTGKGSSGFNDFREENIKATKDTAKSTAFLDGNLGFSSVGGKIVFFSTRHPKRPHIRIYGYIYIYYYIYIYIYIFF